MKVADGNGTPDLDQWIWTESFSYDVHSNRISKANGWGRIDYAYNAANQLMRAGKRTYTHDGNGAIISRTEFKSGSHSSTRGWQNPSWKEKTYYGQDVLGSTQLVTNTRGEQVETYTYDAFGHAYEGNLTSSNAYGYDNYLDT